MSNTEETHDFYKDAQVLLESVLQELLLRVNLAAALSDACRRKRSCGALQGAD